MTKQVFLKHGDVTVGALDVEVPEAGRANVDRKAVVDKFRGEQATEVMRREPDSSQLKASIHRITLGPDHRAESGTRLRCIRVDS